MPQSLETSAPDTEANNSPAGPSSLPHSLRSLVLRGSIWTLGGFGASQVLRLGGNLIVSRLLFPEAFGLMALVTTFLIGLELFSDVGIGPSLIQHRRGEEPAFRSTAWTIQAVRGLALTLVAWLLAWPVGHLWFRKPELPPMLAAAGLLPLLQAFLSTKTHLAIRHLLFRPYALYELAFQLVTLLATVAAALAWRSAWALVLGTLFGAGVRVWLSHVMLPGTPDRFGFDRQSASELLGFGRWIFPATAMTFLAAQGDRVLLGRILGTATLGVYNLAAQLALVPVQIMAQVSAKVLFPTFSRVANTEPDRLPAIYRSTMLRLAAITLPCVALLALTGPLVVRILFDPRYAEAGSMLRILAAQLLIETILVPSQGLLMAIGRPQYNFWAQLLKAAGIFLGVPIAFQAAGVTGAVWAIALAGLPGIPVALVGLVAQGIIGGRRRAGALPQGDLGTDDGDRDRDRDGSR